MENTSIPAKISCIKLHGYKITLDENAQGKPIARLFKFITVGKNKDTYKLIEGFYFMNEGRRTEWIKDKIELITNNHEDKSKNLATKKAVRENMKHTFEVGQVYYDSWGYDQTNIDFYEIVEVKPKSVVIRSIAGEYCSSENSGLSSMSSMVKPVPGKYIGEPHLKPVCFYIKDGEPHYYISSKHGWISLYDKAEKGVYSSWYH